MSGANPIDIGEALHHLGGLLVDLGATLGLSDEVKPTEILETALAVLRSSADDRSELDAYRSDPDATAVFDELAATIGLTGKRPREILVSALSLLQATEAERAELAAYREAEKSSGIGGEGRVERITEAMLRLSGLRQAGERLALKSQSDDAVLDATVARLGGTVEGRPTARLNFLQRVDQLRDTEKLYKAGAARRGRAIAVIRQTLAQIEGVALDVKAALRDVESEP